MAKSDLRPLGKFLLVFALLYALLIAPWPGVRDAYSWYLCSFARVCFGDDGGLRSLRFNTVPAAQRNRALDTRITIANRTQLNADGSVPAVMLDLDSRGIGMIPTALVCALVLATPLPWKRRALALLLGLIAMHAFLFLTLQVCIWDLADEARNLGLRQLPPFWKMVVSGLDETFVTQLGANIVVSILVWIVATFRPSDLHSVSLKIATPGPA